MSKSITVEIVVRKTFNAEVDDDFDFEDEGALNDFVSNLDNDQEPDLEDWQEVEVTDDESGDYYAL